MAENRDTYILPCPCGRNLIVQPRQAGETLQCQCGRDSSVPTMGEIRRLQPAEGPAAVATESKWGSSQRFLVFGISLILLAGIVAAVLGSLQYADHLRFLAEVQRQHDAALHLPPWTAIQIYRYRIAPGIETPLDERFQGSREKMEVGMVIAGMTAIFGVVFAAVGVVGLSRRKRSKTSPNIVQSDHNRHS